MTELNQKNGWVARRKLLLIDVTFDTGEARGRELERRAREAEVEDVITVAKCEELDKVPGDVTGIMGHSEDLQCDWVNEGTVPVIHYSGGRVDIPIEAIPSKVVAFGRPVQRNGDQAPTTSELVQIKDWFLGSDELPACVEPAELDLLSPLTVLYILCHGYLLIAGQLGKGEFVKGVSENDLFLASEKEIGKQAMASVREVGRKIDTIVASESEREPGWFDVALEELKGYVGRGGERVTRENYWYELEAARTSRRTAVEKQISDAIETAKLLDGGAQTGELPAALRPAIVFCSENNVSTGREAYSEAVRCAAQLCAAILKSGGLNPKLPATIAKGEVVAAQSDDRDAWFELIRDFHLAYQLLAMVHL